MTEISRDILRRHVVFWLAIFVFFGVFLYVFSGVLLPFVAGMALAYFLDPVADRMEKWGMSRLLATLLILVAFVVIFIVAIVGVVPLLISQANEFIANIPEYASELQNLVSPADAAWIKDWIGTELPNLKESFGSLLTQGAGFLGTFFLQIWNSGMALVNLVSLLVVTPVVAFYLLLDWDRMVETVDSWIPRNHVDDVHEISRDMNKAIAGFVRGQGTVCIILGAYYGIGLTLTGLNFGLLIGLFAGLISFIPYVGSFTGLVLSFGVALVQFWPDYINIALVLIVFFTGQFFEGNILQPKLVGTSVGLHPVWLMFALFAFGSLFGFVGLLVAVPAAAAIAVLVRFGLKRYLASDYYDEGTGPPAGTGADGGSSDE